MGLVDCIGLNGHIGHNGLISLRGLGSLVGHTDLIGPIGLIGLVGQNSLVGFIGLERVGLVGLIGHIIGLRSHGAKWLSDILSSRSPGFETSAWRT